MKKFIVITFLILWFGPVKAQDNRLEVKISISFTDLKIKDVLKQIESKTKVSFAFSKIGALEKRISGDYQQVPLGKILSKILKKENLSFKQVGGKIVIFKSKKANTSKVNTLRGYIYEESSGEILIGCSVYVRDTYVGAITNKFGFFSLRLPDNELPASVVISFAGFEDQEIVISASGQRDFYLKESPTVLDELVVTAESGPDLVQNIAFGTTEMKSREITAIPAIAGEVDVMKSVTLIPGIKQGVEGTAGFYVRGGGADQNLILLDGVPIYNPYHLWGFLSSFNADAINNVEITKGAFPARFGGRLSSVLDITMKEGNNQKWTKDVTLGLLSAKAAISGPIVKDKSSLMLSVRRTYADLLVVPFLKEKNSSGDTKRSEGYNFTDLNLKANYKFSNKDRLYFSGFFSRDLYFDRFTDVNNSDGVEFTDESETDLGWGNFTSSIRWNHVFGRRLFVNSTIYYTSYNYFSKDQASTTSADPDIIAQRNASLENRSNVKDLALKQDYEYFQSDNSLFRFGFNVIRHKFKPGVRSFFSETGSVNQSSEIGNENISANELAVYLEDEFSVKEKFKFNLGIHASAFFVQNSSYNSIQPRLSALYLFSDKFSVKAGYSRMAQYLHLLTSSGISQSSDLWVPATEKVKPQLSEQIEVSLGMGINEAYQLEVSGYHKQLDNIIDYKDGADFLSERVSWEDQIASGTGEAYGGEFLLKKIKGKLTGFLGYTLSWSNRQSEEINFGRVYPFRYDRRHDISINGNYQLTDKWQLNGVWVFNTGNAVTVPNKTFLGPEFNGNRFSNFRALGSTVVEIGSLGTSGVIDNASERNNFRLPNYHRMDLTASHIKKKKWGERKVSFGFTNVYNRFNPSIFRNSRRIKRGISTSDTGTSFETRTLFPLLPTFSYSASF